LPPTVQLAPGQNKYVLVRVKDDDDDLDRSSSRQYLWFVKSATPKDCGGPYHSNVAQDLVEWIQAAGYTDIVVTGGGRIDYHPDGKTANVYGFSYGYGKGDHRRAARLIQEKQGILASYDDSDKLY
jgi:phosphohistidine phosphatase